MHAHMNVKLFLVIYYFLKTPEKSIYMKQSLKVTSTVALGTNWFGLSNVNIQCPLWSTT